MTRPEPHTQRTTVNHHVRITTAALFFALAVPAAAQDAAAPAAEATATPVNPDTEPREAFWGNEIGRPYDETDAYTLPVLPLRLSGGFWVDNGFMRTTPGEAGKYETDQYYSQGRFVLGAAYRRDVGALFAEARAQLVALDNTTQGQYEPLVQDAFVRIGGRRWDVQAGRFLGWEPYYRGSGIERYTAEEAGAPGGASMYRVDAAVGRLDEPGQVAFHLYPTDWVALELGGVYGQDTAGNNLGVRPAVALRKAGFLFMGAYEYLNQAPQAENVKAEFTTKGFGGRLQYTLHGVTVGVNAAKARVDAVAINGDPDGQKSLDKQSVGAFVEAEFWNNVVGAGYHVTEQEDDAGQTNEHRQAFVSYLYRLPVEGLALKGVFGYALAEIDPGVNPYENKMTSFRIRLSYDFR